MLYKGNPKRGLTPPCYRVDIVPMKTMPILIAVLLANRALAGEHILDVDKIMAEREALYQRLQAGPNISDTINSSDEAAKPMKVDYSLITLPDGKTASVLTFK